MDFEDVSLNDFGFIEDSYVADSGEVDFSDVSSGEVLVNSSSISDNDVSDNDGFTLLSDLSADPTDYTEILTEIEYELGEVNNNLNVCIGISLLCIAFYFSKRLINFFKE